MDKSLFRIDARRIVIVVDFGVPPGDGLVPVGRRSPPTRVALINESQPDNEPASDFSYEHLRRLEHRLLERVPLLGVGVVAVPHALIVLHTASRELARSRGNRDVNGIGRDNCEMKKLKNLLGTW